MAIPSWFRRPLVISLSLGPILAGAAGIALAEDKKSQGSVLAPAAVDLTQTDRNVLTTTFRLREAFDNALATGQSGDPVSGTYTFAESEFRYTRKHQRSQWLTVYRLSTRIHDQHPGLNTLSHDAKVQWQARVSTGTTLLLSQRWADLPGGGVTEANPQQVFPLLAFEDENLDFLVRRRRVMESAAAMQFQYGPRTTLLLGGNLNSLSYTLSEIVRSRAIDGYLQITHRATAGQTIGFSYARQWILFPGDAPDARVHNFMVSYNSELSPTLTFSAFGGPALVREEGTLTTPARLFGLPIELRQAVDDQRFSWVGGVALKKEFRFASVDLMYSRKYSHGTAYSATGLRQTAGLNFSRRMTRRLTAGIGASFSNSEVGSTTDTAYSSARVQPLLRYEMNPGLAFTLTGAAAHVFGGQTAPGLRRQVISGGLEYTFDWRRIGK